MDEPPPQQPIRLCSSFGQVPRVTSLKEIRRVPGHELFMLGQTVAEMQECITEGSIARHPVPNSLLMG